MSSFTPQVPLVIDFDGDTVTMQLKRFKKKHSLKLAPIMAKIEKLNKERGVTDDSMPPEVLPEWYNAVAEILPECIDEWNGLKTVDGVDIKLVEAIEEQYFTVLIAEVMGNLFRISKPAATKEEDELKNLQAQPLDTSMSESCANQEEVVTNISADT